MKDYLILLLCACAPTNGFAQDAIEYSILNGHVSPCGDDQAADIRLVMGQYDAIISRYHDHLCDVLEMAGMAASMPA